MVGGRGRSGLGFELCEWGETGALRRGGWGGRRRFTSGVGTVAMGSQKSLVEGERVRRGGGHGGCGDSRNKRGGECPVRG